MILYYYTTTQTMQFILTNSNMFATNMSYMNDSEEYVNGLSELYFILSDTDGSFSKWKEKYANTEKIKNIDFDRIRQKCTEENLKKFKRQCDSYSISFCTKGDLLSQWSMYAKESGVSLTMDFSRYGNLRYKGYEKGNNKTEREYVVDDEVILEPKPVYYFTHSADMDEKQKMETADKILDDFFLNQSAGTDICEYFEDQWKAFSTYIKRYDFYQENEHRIVFNQKELRVTPRIDYRNDKNVLKPYLDIECESGWPVLEVTLGPGQNQDAVFRSLMHFLDHADIVCHIENEGEYWKRVERYMEKTPELWKNTDKNYPEELGQLRAKINKGRKSLEKIYDKNIIHSMVQETVNAILSDKNPISESQKKFFRDNYFSVSGIVLRKSEIPYIF